MAGAGDKFGLPRIRDQHDRILIGTLTKDKPEFMEAVGKARRPLRVCAIAHGLVLRGSLEDAPAHPGRR